MTLKHAMEKMLSQNIYIVTTTKLILAALKNY